MITQETFSDNFKVFRKYMQKYLKGDWKVYKFKTAYIEGDYITSEFERELKKEEQDWSNSFYIYLEQDEYLSLINTLK